MWHPYRDRQTDRWKEAEIDKHTHTHRVRDRDTQTDISRQWERQTHTIKQKRERRERKREIFIQNKISSLFLPVKFLKHALYNSPLHFLFFFLFVQLPVKGSPSAAKAFCVFSGRLPIQGQLLWPSLNNFKMPSVMISLRFKIFFFLPGSVPLWTFLFIWVKAEGPLVNCCQSSTSSLPSS